MALAGTGTDGTGLSMARQLPSFAVQRPCGRVAGWQGRQSRAQVQVHAQVLYQQVEPTDGKRLGDCAETTP